MTENLRVIEDVNSLIRTAQNGQHAPSAGTRKDKNSTDKVREHDRTLSFNASYTWSHALVSGEVFYSLDSEKMDFMSKYPGVAPKAIEAKNPALVSAIWASTANEVRERLHYTDLWRVKSNPPTK